MQLIAIEDNAKKLCVGRELQRLNATTTFWTSGSTSANCSNKYAWCGYEEMVDFDGLKFPRLISKTGSDCLALSTQQLGRVELIKDECRSKKQVICQRPVQCTSVLCPSLQCKVEKVTVVGACMMNKCLLPGVISIKACKREIRVEVHVLMTYYKASRFACATGFPLISLENKEKIECVTAAFFDEKKIPTGRYWVSLMSMGCTTTHRWCNFADNPYLQEFKDFVWKKGEPSVDPTKECVAVDFQRDYPYFTFLKLDCNIQLKSLSEAKNTA